MKSKFSEQELKERTLDLLYGLLDEDEAEELRRLIASDATAARIFDEAREAADRFARAARWEEAPEAEIDETAAKNVAVESAPFDGGASFLFGAAFVGDALAANVDAETAASGTAANLAETDGESSGSNRKRAKRRLNLLRKLKSDSKTEVSEKEPRDVKRGGLGKERRREKTRKPEKAAQPASASRFRFGSKERVDGESGWATVGRKASGEGGRRSAARRFWARLPKPTLFQNLIIALAVVALSTAVGFWAQETALQARFRDDFRIQIAAPRTLARGESQTIAATTTAPNGKPRRVPIRFSFSDAETGTPFLAHTESGDASGVARFKIPDVSDFPARTRLTIVAGEREKETFETILTVVDAPQANVGANAAARFAASGSVGKDVAENVVENVVEPRAAKKNRAQEKATRPFRPGDADARTISDRSPASKATTSASPVAPMGASVGQMGASEAAPVGQMGASEAAPVGQMGASEAAPVAPMGASVGQMGASEAAPVGSMGAMGASPDGQMNAMGAFGLAAQAETTVEDAPATPDSARAVEALKRALDVAPDAVSRSKTRKSSPASSVELDAVPAFCFSAGMRNELNELGATAASEKRGLDVRFYPVGERLVAGRENVVWFACVDEAGRPVVGEFALNDSEGRVATAKTSEGGVGAFRWTPDADETYSLETAFDGKVAKIVEIDKDGGDGKSAKYFKTVKNDKNSKNGSGGDDKEKVAAEEPAQAELASNDSVEDWRPRSTFETFRFSAPTATVERVSFAVPSPVLENGKNVALEIWAEKEIPLAATVEKNGVALAQLVWTAKKGRRRVVVPLDADVSGALNVSLWNCARTPFERIGSAAVYRKPAVAPTLDATLERKDARERALRIAVEPGKGLRDAKTVRLETFWAPTLDAALGALELDEALLYASDERRVETLGTLALPPAVEPILFDNLLEMKESALKKLNAFWLGEAGLAGRVVGLGFVGCAALAALTIFCVLLGALKARRGAVVVLFCAALATFFYFERRRIDFSETLSEAIAVSVDESKAAQRNADALATVANVPNDGAEEAATEDVQPAALLRIDEVDALRPTSDAGWRVPLTERLATTDVGVVLVKAIADDGTRAWKAIPLGERGGEETEESR